MDVKQLLSFYVFYVVVLYVVVFYVVVFMFLLLLLILSIKLILCLTPLIICFVCLFTHFNLL